MTFDFECEEPFCGFKSTGWATEELRNKRAVQHMDEHETQEAMQELHEFESDNNVSYT